MGEEALRELGASNIHLGRKREKKKRKKLLLMELVNICCSVPGCAPREVSEGRGWGRENKMKENLLFCSFPLCKDTKQTNRGIRMRALCGC